MVAGMAENWDLGRGPPNITTFGSLEMVGLSTLIEERVQLTLFFTHKQLCWGLWLCDSSENIRSNKLNMAGM